jgi:lysophospholipid acyltransferase (LPLAT)-like uncharacterized protein
MSASAESGPRERKRSLQRRVKKALRRGFVILGLYTIPYLYMAYMWFVYHTSRVETLGPHPHRMREMLGQGIYALWHDEVFFVAYSFKDYHGHTLASEGDAGAIITRMLELCNYTVFRGGSTSKKRRRSSAELVHAMVDHMKAQPGVIYGITTDGSTGPIYRMKDGAVRIAVGSGAPLGVVKTWCKRYVQLRTWDRTLVPLPFNHIVHVFSGPIVPSDSSSTPEGFEALRDEVERQLCRVTAYARRITEGLPLPRDWIDLFPEHVREEMARADEPVLFLPYDEVGPGGTP